MTIYSVWFINQPPNVFVLTLASRAWTKLIIQKNAQAFPSPNATYWYHFQPAFICRIRGGFPKDGWGWEQKKLDLSACNAQAEASEVLVLVQGKLLLSRAESHPSAARFVRRARGTQD
jgi:hypothetical protein